MSKGTTVRQEWESEDLVGAWTLVDDDWRRIANKRGATRLGFALLLRFFELEARFPEDPDELPAVVVAYVADQVKVPAYAFDGYGWSSRAIKYHRAEIRKTFGFREASRSDEARLTAWLHRGGPERDIRSGAGGSPAGPLSGRADRATGPGGAHRGRRPGDGHHGIL